MLILVLCIAVVHGNMAMDEEDPQAPRVDVNALVQQQEIFHEINDFAHSIQEWVEGGKNFIRQFPGYFANEKVMPQMFEVLNKSFEQAYLDSCFLLNRAPQAYVSVEMPVIPFMEDVVAKRERIGELTRWDTNINDFASVGERFATQADHLFRSGNTLIVMLNSMLVIDERGYENPRFPFLKEATPKFRAIGDSVSKIRDSLTSLSFMNKINIGLLESDMDGNDPR